MKFEYLIFNIIVISGPLFFGALPKYSFINNIKRTIISLSVPLLPFLIWDSLVTNKHWFFNENYTMDIRFFGLPIEEILFFITVPYACIYSWEMLCRFTSGSNFKLSKKVYLMPLLIIPLGIYLFVSGKEYTGLTTLALAAAILYDKIINAKFYLHKNLIYFVVIIFLLTLIFNGYLTWRPVVTYNELVQLDIRITTIPIEDFFYGFALISLAVSTYIKLGLKK